MQSPGLGPGCSLSIPARDVCPAEPAGSPSSRGAATASLNLRQRPFAFTFAVSFWASKSNSFLCSAGGAVILPQSSCSLVVPDSSSIGSGFTALLLPSRLGTGMSDPDPALGSQTGTGPFWRGLGADPPECCSLVRVLYSIYAIFPCLASLRAGLGHPRDLLSTSVKRG